MASDYAPSRYVELMLQRCHDRGAQALQVNGPTRSGMILIASENIASYLEEVLVIARSSTILWAEHVDALLALGSVVRELDLELGNEAKPISDRLDLLSTITRFVPPSAWNGHAVAGKAKPESDRDRLELAHQSVRAALERLRHLPAPDPTQDMRAQAIAFSAPLQLHLAVAGDAARAVADRRARRSLKPDVEALSAAMDGLAELLAMRPKLAWDAAFAAAFDAENSLRRDLGLVPRLRPYSGTVDPVAAIEQVRGAAAGDAKDARDLHYSDPQAAVGAIDRGLASVFVEQRRAIIALEGHLKRPKPSRPHSWVDTALEIAANVALSSAAGALGALAVRFFGPKLEALNVGLYVKPSAMKLLTEAERNVVTDQILTRKGGALARAVVGEMIKDGTKELFKSATRGALATHVTPLGLGLVEDFAWAQTQKIDAAQLNASLTLNSLMAALQQADLETLNALAHTLLNDTANAAFGVQYDESMREWLNVKARLDAGPATMQMGKDTPRDADVREDHVAGTIEIELMYSGRGAVAVRSMRLHGAEPAAGEHLRRRAIPLQKTGLNVRYHVRFVSDMFEDKVVFGVGPDRGLILESLSRRDWAVLRVAAEHDATTQANVYASMRGEYDRTSDAAVLKTVHGFIQVASGYSTTRLED